MKDDIGVGVANAIFTLSSMTNQQGDWSWAELLVTVQTHTSHLADWCGEKEYIGQYDTHLAESDFKYGCRLLQFMP